jgi:hypothetical protein
MERAGVLALTQKPLVVKLASSETVYLPALSNIERELNTTATLVSLFGRKAGEDCI